MADIDRNLTVESDPLQGLSMFPLTQKSMSISLPPLYQSDDLHQTHTLLQSIPFEVSKELQEQAMAILDESQGVGSSVASEDTNVGVEVNPIPSKRGRRPAYERKRGHFTFKPTTSESSPQKEPTFDPSKYPKPGDYFAAYERFLIAQREWQKQTGTFVKDTHQNQPSRRPRRPELPGRKRGSYKHTYTDSFLTDLKKSEKESPIPSEQSLEHNTAAHVKTAENPIPSEQSLEHNTAAHVKTVDREVDDSTADTDKNLENILTELLACSPDELEGDAGVKLLQERLHIRPIEKQMLSFPQIPEFPDVRRMDLKASVRNPSKPRTALSNIQNLLKGINNDATRKKSQASPSYSPEDQFSFPDRLNLLPGDQQPRKVDIAKDLNASLESSVAKNADKVMPNASPSNVGIVNVASEFNSSEQKSSCEGGSHTLSGVHRSNSSPDRNADNCVDDSITNINPATQKMNVDAQTKGSEGDVPMGESEAHRNTGRRHINEITKQLDNLAEDAPGEDARVDHFTVEDESIPYQQEQYNTMDGSIEHEEHIQGQHGEENDNTVTTCGVQVEDVQEAHNSSAKQTNKRSKRGSGDSNLEKRSKTTHGESVKEKQTKTVSHESGAKKQTKGKPNERKEKTQKKTVTRESKMFSRRKSLAAAGTKWETGVRRSTRIKSRPLEYWRGERFLYGRIHESLTTVIGIKCESPGNKGNGETRALKVKSFVSDDYKELVESAAMH